MFIQRELILSATALFPASFSLRFNTYDFHKLRKLFYFISKSIELFFSSLFFSLRITKSTGCKSTELIALDVGSLLRLGGKEVEVSGMFGYVF